VAQDHDTVAWLSRSYLVARRLADEVAALGHGEQATTQVEHLAGSSIYQT
jgi:hypothetical protein